MECRASFTCIRIVCLSHHRIVRLFHVMEETGLLLDNFILVSQCTMCNILVYHEILQ
jgi:hypothetical protein